MFACVHSAGEKNWLPRRQRHVGLDAMLSRPEIYVSPPERVTAST